MNLSQLHYFQHLAEVQHYTHAAEDLYITQPALSHSIASLEEELGCTLFRKEGRSVRLTEDGEVFKRYVDEGLDAIDRGVTALEDRHGKIAGSINIGAIDTVCTFYLPAAMAEFRTGDTALADFHVFQSDTPALLQHLKAGDYDLTLSGPRPDSEMTLKTLFYQPLAIVVTADNPLAQKKSIGYEDLIGQRVLTYRPGTAIGDILTAFFKDTHAPENEIDFVRAYEDEGMLGAMLMHERGIGLAAVTTNLLPAPNMLVIPFDEPGARDFYPITLSYKTKAYRNSATQHFIEFLEGFTAPSFVHQCQIDR